MPPADPDARAEYGSARRRYACRDRLCGAPDCDTCFPYAPPKLAGNEWGCDEWPCPCHCHGEDEHVPAYHVEGCAVGDDDDDQ